MSMLTMCFVSSCPLHSDEWQSEGHNSPSVYQSPNPDRNKGSECCDEIMQVNLLRKEGLYCPLKNNRGRIGVG